jgi:hypothetical protein
VLAELLLRQGGANDDLLTEFTDRRYQRVRAVVGASLQLCRWLLDRDASADVPGLVARIASLVGEPP